MSNHIIMLAQELGNQIKRRRDMLHITQPDLAELADINVNTLYRIETGKANPTLKVLHKLAEVLGMEIKLEVKKPNL
ncbi:helix-turn-helix transcriptional regulator [uncultured Pontibacter sp.]|uniref:helix-turn-helix transcriptional regulator n=1 Tax=uncultured Pontibacter sp. TaxID=453356 RepID=UPI002633D7C6|nr:helix-turn-helix transcriptional regulator [uncultured Pontibacter sp.]